MVTAVLEAVDGKVIDGVLRAQKQPPTRPPTPRSNQRSTVDAVL